MGPEAVREATWGASVRILQSPQGARISSGASRGLLGLDLAGSPKPASLTVQRPCAGHPDTPAGPLTPAAEIIHSFPKYVLNSFCVSSRCWNYG